MWIVLATAPWMALWWATFPPPVALGPTVPCTKEQCLADPSNLSDDMAKCCRLELGCFCGFYSECDQFEGSIVPLNESFYVDFGSTRCTCQCDQKLECVRTPCPIIPVSCQDIVYPMDGCAYCGDSVPGNS